MPNHLIPGTNQQTNKQADISMSAHSHKLVLEHTYGLFDLCLTCNEAGVGGGGEWALWDTNMFNTSPLSWAMMPQASRSHILVVVVACYCSAATLIDL